MPGFAGTMKIAKWRPPTNFVTLHYVYIIFMGVLALAVLYPAGNLSVVDAYFFGASASTESGLNTIDVKDLYLYQQLYLYFIPIFTNLGFINAVVVLVRLLWFRKHINTVAPILMNRRRKHGQSEREDEDVEVGCMGHGAAGDDDAVTQFIKDSANADDHPALLTSKAHTITFDANADHHSRTKTALYAPEPRDRDQGHQFVELSKQNTNTPDDISINVAPQPGCSSPGPSTIRRRHVDDPPLTRTRDRISSFTTSMFVIGGADQPPNARRSSTHPSASQQHQREVGTRDMLALSRHATLGRNSDFRNLTQEDREKLGGIEYRSLKLLLKIVLSYFFGLHLFGAICLLGWIHYADPKYKDYINQQGQEMNWWAFYSAQTMVNNLGFTLTPDSMISFRDAQWPMFIMSFLAFAGNTLYPVFLRLVIWTTSKLAPKKSSMQEPLCFLLNHPRRCYTLLFPSRPTWILFGIIFLLNFFDTVLILVLDLHNEEVSTLPLGPRILAAIFQAASARHTGTSSFNLANLNPAVQFSLLVMMYISIFPIAISIRASNTYEERSLGIYKKEIPLDELDGRDYFISHMRNQLSFDLWFVFFGVFCICIAESGKIVDNDIPAFTVWTIFFEVMSAYGNVGLSLGHPAGMTSLSGYFSPFSKLIVCIMMIRGRHRGLPYALDRAIMLPDESVSAEGNASRE